MKTQLVSVTQPLPKYLEDNNLPTNLDAEQLTVYIARVSSPRIDKTEKPEGLLKYCLDKCHWSVFEHITITAEIVTSVAISIQMLRHRSFTFQQFSQRYAEVTEFEPFELRKQAEKNRQSSTDVFDPFINFNEITGDSYSQINGNALVLIERHLENTQSLYKELLENDVAKESARFILPVCAETKLYMTGSLRSWIHYFAQRCDEHTQKEHQEIAYSIRTQMKEYFPIISNVLNW